MQKNKSLNLDQYEIQKVLGKGTEATVYQAEKDGKKYAVKVPEEQYTEERLQKKVEKQILEEQSLFNQFSSENIVKMVDMNLKGQFQDQIMAYSVYELCENGDLCDYMQDVKSISENQCKQFFIQIYSALNEMHSKGYVHRDIKIDNILVTKDLNAKIADFGFVEKFVEGQKFTNYLGTQHYMSPELLNKGQRSYDGVQADLFALGVVVFCIALTTFPSSSSCSADDKIYKYMAQKRTDKYWQQFERRNNLNTYSKDFKDFVTGMIACDPQDRMSKQQIENHPWIQNEYQQFQQQQSLKIEESLSQKQFEGVKFDFSGLKIQSDRTTECDTDESQEGSSGVKTVPMFKY